MNPKRIRSARGQLYLDGRGLCKRCNRVLCDERSVARGYGRSCYRRQIEEWCEEERETDGEESSQTETR